MLLKNVLEPTRHRRRITTADGGVDCISRLPKDLLFNMINSDKSSPGRASAAFIAQTYGGIELPPEFEKTKMKRKSNFKSAISKVMHSNIFVKGIQADTAYGVDMSGVNYLPTEFKRLDLDKRMKLARMLTWDKLKVWGFDTFEVEKISAQKKFCYEGNDDINELDGSLKLWLDVNEHGCPIVLIGWAVLASPYAQLAMAKDVDDPELIEQAEYIIKQKAKDESFPFANMLCKEFSEDSFPKESDTAGDKKQHAGYYILDHLGITPRAICQFLRKVEKDYPRRDVNPYHNNIHASDVIQTTHALIQMGGPDLAKVYECLDIFTILIAAALHDVHHPGTNNNYQVNKQTDLALMYNDRSVLENMHASRASHLLKEFGGDADGKDTAESIFGTMTNREKVQVRAGIIKSILNTDMSYHFKSVAKIEGYIGDVMDEINLEPSNLSESKPVSLLARLQNSKHSKLKEKLLPFILHLADISNPTKSPELSLEWSQSTYDEFFLQGDKEASEGMPISPLCDRATTCTSDGQIGFITYVVKPAFLVLQKCLPGISSVLTQLDDNLEYWRTLKKTA